MAEMKVEGEVLRKLVRLGKRQRLSFAFNPGPKNDHIILIDRKKSPEVVAKIARKEGAGTKVAFGTFVVVSKTMELTCERTVPAMAKTLKKYLKSQKVMVNILIMDENGTVLDSDVEDSPDDPSLEEDETEALDEHSEDAGEQPAATEVEAPQQTGAADGRDTADPAPDRAGLAARLKAIQPIVTAAQAESAAKLKKAMAMAVAQIKAGDLAAADKTVVALEAATARLAEAPAQDPAASAPSETGPDLRALAARAGALKDAIGEIQGPAKEKLTTALGHAAKMLKAGDLAAANILLGRIEGGVNKVSAATQSARDADTAPPPEAAKWQAAEARLQPAVDRLMQERRGDLDAINRFFNYARDQATAGNFDKALAAAARTADLIKQAADMQGSAAAHDAGAAIPANVVAYTQSRLAWIKTRSGLRKEIDGLKSAIDKATAGIEGLEQVSEKSDGLFDYLEEIDESLEETLEALVEAPDGNRREALKTKARRIIDGYRSVLDTGFFKDVDRNGFARTSIRASALASLQEVSTALET